MPQPSRSFRHVVSFDRGLFAGLLGLPGTHWWHPRGPLDRLCFSPLVPLAGGQSGLAHRHCSYSKPDPPSSLKSCLPPLPSAGTSPARTSL